MTFMTTLIKIILLGPNKTVVRYRYSVYSMFLIMVVWVSWIVGWSVNDMAYKRTKTSNHTQKRTCNRKRPVWLNGWVFLYELSGFGFEYRCCYLNFRYRACFEPRVPWHSGKYREQFILKNVCDMIRTHRQIHFSLAFSSAVNRLFTPYTIVGKFNQTIRILWWRFHHLFASV